MKEATGELNMTVITVVAIAAIAAFFYLFIWPSMQKSMVLTSACNASNAGTDINYKDTVDNETVSCGNGVCNYKNTTKSCKATGQ